MTSILRENGSQVVGLSSRGVTAENVEAKICAQVWKKQIRIKTFFEDYDKLRKGFCIEDKFISGLSSALSFLNLHLTAEQIKSVSDKYRVSPGDLVRYLDFVATIDSQFGNTDLALSNIQTLKQNSAISSGEEQETLAELLNYIKWSISSKRIYLKNPLQDYDKTKSTYIKRDQFIRVLDNLGLVRNGQLADLLCRKYSRSSNPKEICYVDFIKDVENINEVQAYVVRGIVPNERSTHLTNVVEDINNHSLTQAFYVSKRLPEQNLPINDILRRIQAEVTLKRIRIREFFLDFDGLRKNIVTGEQFRRVLASLNLQLSNNDYKEIVAAYRVYPQGSREERVKWMDFCEDVDLVYTKKGLEKAPLERVPQIGKTVFEPVKHIAVKFTPEEEEAVQELLRNYQTAITSKRAHLKPLFEDFDITKIGYVTKNQFTRILKQFDFVPSDDRLYNLLLKLYMDRGNIDEVNYYQFVRDVDKYHEDGQALSLAHTSQFESFKQQPRTHKAVIRDDVPDGLEDLLNRIRSIVKERRIRVAEFMKDFDKLRHGKITKDKFRLSLNMAKIAISEPQFQLIISNFECKDKPNSIRWKDFCDSLDSVFTVKELQKVTPNQSVELSSTNFNYGKASISPEQLAEATRIKEAFKEYQLVNRLDIKDLFANWDKLSCFKVTPKQFRQVLATIGFNLTEEENSAICKLYASEDEKEGLVKYLQFLRDTKPYDFSYMTEMKDEVKRGTGQLKKIPDNIGDILEVLRQTTKINRLRYREYFKDFDPLNKGTIKSNKFESVVSQTMKVPLQKQLFQIMLDYYGEESDKTVINYSRFCDDLEIVFNLPDREKEPTLRPQDFDYTVTYGRKDQQAIDALMKRLGEVTRKHRILLKPFFQDNDVARIGRVSATRMRSILDNNKIPLTEEQFSLLYHHFAYEHEFNYISFIEALKIYEAEQ